MKPGYKTTEFWQALIAQGLSLLAMFGLVNAGDTQTLEDAIGKCITAVFIRHVVLRDGNSRNCSNDAFRRSCPIGVHVRHPDAAELPYLEQRPRLRRQCDGCIQLRCTERGGVGDAVPFVESGCQTGIHSHGQYAQRRRSSDPGFGRLPHRALQLSRIIGRDQRSFNRTLSHPEAVMSKPLLFRHRARLAVSLRALLKRTEGIAAVEFALIAPIMATLFVGSVEMSQAVTANRRVTQVGSTTGDLVARAQSNISDSDVLDMMKVGSYLLSPFSIAGLKVNIRVVGSSATDATATKLEWMCAYDATSPSSVSCSPGSTCSFAAA